MSRRSASWRRRKWAARWIDVDKGVVVGCGIGIFSCGYALFGQPVSSVAVALSMTIAAALILLLVWRLPYFLRPHDGRSDVRELIRRSKGIDTQPVSEPDHGHNVHVVPGRSKS